MHFRYETSPSRVVFGRGTVRSTLAEEVERLGMQRVLVVTDRQHERLAREAAAPFTDAVAAWFAGAEERLPSPLAARAIGLVRSVRADGVLAVGGTAATGTATVLARDSRLPVLAVPTTYAAAEMTQWGSGPAGRHTTTDAGGHPRSVVLDPDLTDAVPQDSAVAAGLVAFGYVVESYWAPRANPVSAVLADEAVAALAAALRGLGALAGRATAEDEVAVTDPVGTWAGTAQKAREQLLYGGYLAGTVVATTGTGLHHRIAQFLTTTFALPPSEAHAVVLPHVLAFNAPAVPDVAVRLAAALETDHALTGVRALYGEVGAPRDLTQLGLRPKQLEEGVERFCATLPVDNPRHVGRAEVREILTAAVTG